MAIKVTPIVVKHYEKVFFDELNQDDWIFAVQNAVLIDGTPYLINRI